jgi:hypothetical protein
VTSTPTATATSTRTATFTSTRTTTPSPTPTAILTATPQAIGGKNATLRAAADGSVALGWTDGVAETGYFVVRLIPGTVPIVLPLGGTPLPATATSYVVPQPLPAGFQCYAALPVNAAGTLGRSDVVCVVPDTQSSAGAPPFVAVRLSQSDTATILWAGLGGETAFRVTAIPLDGSAQRLQTLPPTTLSATNNTGGIPTCYVVTRWSGPTQIGSGNVVCAIPGLSTLGGATVAETVRHDVAAALARVRAAVERIDSARVPDRTTPTPTR